MIKVVSLIFCLFVIHSSFALNLCGTLISECTTEGKIHSIAGECKKLKTVCEGDYRYNCDVLGDCPSSFERNCSVSKGIWAGQCIRTEMINCMVEPCAETTYVIQGSKYCQMTRERCERGMVINKL